MARALSFLYGVVAYAIFLATFLYAIGFVGNVVVPKTIDSGAGGALVPALIVNAGLLLLFAAQHSVMARPAFKRWWTRLVPPAIERSTYVLFSSLALILLFRLWRPLPEIVWQLENPAFRGLLWSIFALGWTIVLMSTFMIGHWDLFGLRQVWRRFEGRAPVADRFRTPGLYAVVRHPIMLGFFLAFWATPDMTVGHLLFAVATTGYILLGVWLEERDLVERFGAIYRTYRAQIPAFFPRPGRVWPDEGAGSGVPTPGTAPAASGRAASGVPVMESKTVDPGSE